MLQSVNDQECIKVLGGEIFIDGVSLKTKKGYSFLKCRLYFFVKKLFFSFIKENLTLRFVEKSVQKDVRVDRPGEGV
jgi:hypothetical protein